MTDIAERTSIEEVPEESFTKSGLITLHMRPTDPELGWEDSNRNLVFGPYSIHDPQAALGNIRFDDYYATIRFDHELLGELMARYPQVEIVTTEDKERIYIDPSDGREFKSKRAYDIALKAKKNKG